MRFEQSLAAALADPSAGLLALDRLDSEESLAGFVKCAWPQIEPGQPYIHNWHIDAICEHLEAVSRGEITRLLINVPPGTSKSTIVGVFWPMWEWGPLNRPSTRIVGVAHEQTLGIRDNLKCRRLVASDWYQALWGDRVKLTRDQNEKLNFENAATGFRQVATPSNITGRRGDRVILDDPHSVSSANSDAEREAVITWFRESLPTRVNNPDRSAIVVVMQRLHERDVSGIILSEDLGYEHLMLPMEFEPERRCTTSIGFTDPRSEDGELLFPGRFPADVVERDKKAMGSYAWAGQAQQRPTAREGGMFKKSWFAEAFVRAAPHYVRRCRAWDLAGTKKKQGNRPDYTAGVRVSRDSEGFFYVEHVERLQDTPGEVEKTIRTTAEADPQGTKVRIPQDPGQAGLAQVGALTRRLAGFNVVALPVSGDKETRARPAAAQAEAGNIRIVRTGDALRDAWIEPFLDELCNFPTGAFDDQVDAFADAFNELAPGGGTIEFQSTGERRVFEQPDPAAAPRTTLQSVIEANIPQGGGANQWW